MKPPAWIPLLIMLAGYLLLGVAFAWDIRDAGIIATTLFSTSILLWLVRMGFDVRGILRLRSERIRWERQ